ncbi:phosphotransferase family protein [Kocuria sp.]|uniref:phosphotransferase family protein n=1 Tax=Kocuria sp. TaxID=1871328 RepID=UPI0026DB1E6F|nr:phosphotransferase [Kocuria sp.]MDO4918554.1 phosphotransferase [Kocuria sp.]
MTFACGHLPFARAVEAVLAEAGVHVDRSDWELHAGGSAHIVVNAGHMMSVRIAKNPTSGENVRRRTRALTLLPEFDFALPRPLTPVVQDGRYTAVGMTWIPGAARTPGAADPRELRRVLAQLRGADASGAERWLDRPGQHWGGHRRRHVLLEQVLPRLLPRNRERAMRAIEDLVALDTAAPRLVHGDLMGSNMLWQGEHLVGVIDWDHACLSDPAYDVASLGLWFGWSSVRDATDEETLERARLHARIFPLQAVAYALHHELDTAQVRQAVEKADAWYEKRSVAAV